MKITHADKTYGGICTCEPTLLGYGAGVGTSAVDQTVVGSDSTSVILEYTGKRWGSDDFLPGGLPRTYLVAPVAGLYQAHLTVSAGIRNPDNSPITDHPHWYYGAILGPVSAPHSGISTAGPVGAGDQGAGPWPEISFSVSGIGHLNAHQIVNVQIEVEGDIKFTAHGGTRLNLLLIKADDIPPILAAFTDSIADAETIEDPPDGSYRITGDDWATYTATYEADEPTEIPDGYIGWVKLELTSTRTVTIDTNDSGISDTTLWIYDALPTSGSTAVEDDDDGGDGSWSSVGPVSLGAGTYWIAVAPYDGSGWDTGEAEAHLNLVIST